MQYAQPTRKNTRNGHAHQNVHFGVRKKGGHFLEMSTFLPDPEVDILAGWDYWAAMASTWIASFTSGAKAGVA